MIRRGSKLLASSRAWLTAGKAIPSCGVVAPGSGHSAGCACTACHGPACACARCEASDLWNHLLTSLCFSQPDLGEKQIASDRPRSDSDYSFKPGG
eukprot:scaffold136399_cov34-Prasinocladus_malaysianus.AAC.1